MKLQEKIFFFLKKMSWHPHRDQSIATELPWHSVAFLGSCYWLLSVLRALQLPFHSAHTALKMYACTTYGMVEMLWHLTWCSTIFVQAPQTTAAFPLSTPKESLRQSQSHSDPTAVLLQCWAMMIVYCMVLLGILSISTCTREANALLQITCDCTACTSVFCIFLSSLVISMQA